MKIKGIKDKRGNIGYYDIETDKHIKGKKTMRRQDNRLIEAVIIAFLVCVALMWANKAWSNEITGERHT